MPIRAGLTTVGLLGWPTRRALARGARSRADGTNAAQSLPRSDARATNLHLDEIATEVSPGAAVDLLVDQAGWRVSKRLVDPHDIVIAPLPP
jgi:hypothetical protein